MRWQVLIYLPSKMNVCGLYEEAGMGRSKYFESDQIRSTAF